MPNNPKRIQDPTEAAMSAIQEALDTITQAEAQGWFRHCGYSLARST